MAAEFTCILGELIVHINIIIIFLINRVSFTIKLSKVFLPVCIPVKPGRIVLPMFSAIVTS